MSSQEEFLSGGASYPAVKFLKIGDTVKGTIKGTPQPIQRPSLNNGELQWQLPVNMVVDGEDRTLWVPKSQLSAAIGEACTAANVAGLADGGELIVKFTEERPTKYPQPQKIFKAKYTPPAAPTVGMDDVFGDDGEEEPF